MLFHFSWVCTLCLGICSSLFLLWTWYERRLDTYLVIYAMNVFPSNQKHSKQKLFIFIDRVTFSHVFFIWKQVERNWHNTLKAMPLLYTVSECNSSTLNFLILEYARLLFFRFFPPISFIKHYIKQWIKNELWGFSIWAGRSLLFIACTFKYLPFRTC